MKKLKNELLILSIIVIVSSSCSKYGHVTLQYPIASQAVLPESIHKIAIVNRSLVKKEDKQNSLLEAVVSGEIAGSDKKASGECLKGAYDKSKSLKQVEMVIPATNQLYGTGKSETPELVEWKIIKQICNSEKVDALLVLETFDSNSNILTNTVNTAINSVLTGTPPAPSSNQITMNVQCFWRLYDPVNQKIIDQHQSTNYFTFDKGTSVIVIPPQDALLQTAYRSGMEYIQRFLPNYYYVKRNLYKKGKHADKQRFLSAFRKSEVADWEGALQAWEPLTKSENRKNAGRACLNMAVAYEVLGETDKALIWAKKGYTDFGNKLARDYQNQLQNRLYIE